MHYSASRRAIGVGLTLLVAACGSDSSTVSPNGDAGADTSLPVDASRPDAASDAAEQLDGSRPDAQSSVDGGTDASPVDAASCIILPGATPAQILAVYAACYGGVNVGVVDGQPHRAVDVLFLVDDSPSMTPKQAALVQNIATFVQAIDATNADYHIGIATSDVGSYTAPNMPWPVSLGGCNSFAGDDGALQVLPCSVRTGSATALAACQAMCPDSTFVPNDGKSFIAKTNGVTNVPSKMVGGKDVGPVNAFQCMALLGDVGCGIEGQFEGVKRALDGHNAQNAGFLRASSVLAVIVLTDEDDCSVSLAGRPQNDPTTMDCPTPDPNAASSCFNPDYRCMATDVTCTEPLNTVGGKHNCSERAASYLEKVDTYTQFLSALRPQSRFFFGGIWAPNMAAGGAFNVVQNGTGTPGLNRASDATAACVSAGNPNLFARPQVRLSKLASQLGGTEVNVCDDANLAQALSAMAKTVTTRLDVGCTSGVPKMDGGGNAMCVVGDVPADQPASAPTAAFPQCSAACCGGWAASAYPTSADTGVKAACASEAAAACFCALPSTQVGVCPGSDVAGVWRKNGAAPPSGTVTTFECAR